MEKKYTIALWINVFLTVLCAGFILLGMMENSVPEDRPDVATMTEQAAGQDMPDAHELPEEAPPATRFDFKTIFVKCLMLLLVVVYAVWGYKKPHGNMLKYLMLAFAAYLLSFFEEAVQHNALSNVLIVAVSIGMITFIAGRLHKIGQNRFLSVVVFLLLFGLAAFPFAESVSMGNTARALGEFTTPILWSDLCAAYFTRYLQHKEAGLLDKKE